MRLPGFSRVGRRFAVLATGVVVAATATLTIGAGSALAANYSGRGTLIAFPHSVPSGATGRTINFLFTADGQGVSGGVLGIFVPDGWTPPSTTRTDDGYVTSSCGSVAVEDSIIVVQDIYLEPNRTCNITYGSRIAGGAGVTVPQESSQIVHFYAAETSNDSAPPTPLRHVPGIAVVDHSPA